MVFVPQFCPAGTSGPVIVRSKAGHARGAEDADGDERLADPREEPLPGRARRVG